MSHAAGRRKPLRHGRLRRGCCRDPRVDRIEAGFRRHRAVADRGHRVNRFLRQDRADRSGSQQRVHVGSDFRNVSRNSVKRRTRFGLRGSQLFGQSTTHGVDVPSEFVEALDDERRQFCQCRQMHIDIDGLVGRPMVIAHRLYAYTQALREANYECVKSAAGRAANSGWYPGLFQGDHYPGPSPPEQVICAGYPAPYEHPQPLPYPHINSDTAKEKALRERTGNREATGTPFQKNTGSLDL